jgi:hypothetical protein
MFDLDKLDQDYMKTLQKQENLAQTITGLIDVYSQLNEQLKAIDEKRDQIRKQAEIEEIFNSFEFTNF